MGGVQCRKWGCHLHNVRQRKGIQQFELLDVCVWCSASNNVSLFYHSFLAHIIYMHVCVHFYCFYFVFCLFFDFDWRCFRFFLVSTLLSFAVEANKICVIRTQTRATTNIHIPHTYAYIHTFIHLYVRLYKQTANSSMLFMQHAEATTNNERFNTPSLYRCIISAFVCMEVSEPVRIGWWVKTL